MSRRLESLKIKALLSYFRNIFKDNKEISTQIDIMRTMHHEILLDITSSEMLYNYFMNLQTCNHDSIINPEAILDDWREFNITYMLKKLERE